MRLQQVLAADVKMGPIKSPDNLLPWGGWPQREPPFNLTGKKAERLAQLQRAEQSTKIAAADHGEILEEMRRRQVLDYDEAEETEEDEEEDDVSTSGDNNSQSESDSSDDDS